MAASSCPLVPAGALPRCHSHGIRLALPAPPLSGPTLFSTLQAEVEYLAKAGLREDYMLLRALEPGSHELPVFRGAHVLPLYPGPAAG